MNPIARGLGLIQRLYHDLDRLAPVADLALRLYVASVFWKSGLVKIQSWSSTLYLFQYEYAVPLLPPTAAAYLGTGIELAFPVLLGLAGRPVTGPAAVAVAVPPPGPAGDLLTGRHRRATQKRPPPPSGVAAFCTTRRPQAPAGLRTTDA